MGRPQVTVWTNPSWTGDGIAPGSTELVVVGRVHVKGVGKSGLSVGSVGWMVSDLLKGSQTVLDFIAWRAVTLEAQQSPMDDYSTPLSRCSHDNTRFRLRSLMNLPWNTSDLYQTLGTSLQSTCITMGLDSEPRTPSM